MATPPLYSSTPAVGRAYLRPAAAWLTKTKLACIIAFLVLVLAEALNDPDYFWHLKTGEYIIANGALPAGDIFSWSAYGKKWVLHEWLFEVLLFGVFSIAGDLGIRIFSAMTGLLAIGVMAASANRITRHPVCVVLATGLAFMAYAGGVVPRPQLFTFLFIAIYLAKLLDFKYLGRLPSVWLFPSIMVIWVNSHAGYVAGVALLIIFLGSEWLMSFWDKTTARAAYQAQLKKLSVIAGLTVIATLANPWFIEHWVYPFEVVRMSATEVIAEWQSPNFHSVLPRVFLLMIAALVGSAFYARRRPDLTELAIPAFFCFSAFVSLRHISIAVMVSIPFLALMLKEGALAYLLSLWKDTWLAKAYARRFGSGKDLGDAEGALNWLVLGAFVACAVALAPRLEAAQQQRLQKIQPVKATDFVIANDIKGRMFNSYGYGGYLIYRLSPARKVYVDGRADMYGDPLVMDYAQILQGKRDWKERFSKLKIDYAIVGIDAPLRQLLIAEQSFREVYADADHSVLVRNVPSRTTAVASAANPAKPN